MATDFSEVLTAQQRLALSRRALVRHLRGDDEDDESKFTSDSTIHRRQSGGVSSLLASTPYGAVVRNLVERWWSRHPANAAGKLARPMLQRFANEQPVKLIAAAAGVGALVVLVKPWRLLSITALLAAALKTSDIADMVTTLMKRPGEK